MAAIVYQDDIGEFTGGDIAGGQTEDLRRVAGDLGDNIGALIKQLFLDEPERQWQKGVDGADTGLRRREGLQFGVYVMWLMIGTDAIDSSILQPFAQRDVHRVAFARHGAVRTDEFRFLAPPGAA